MPEQQIGRLTGLRAAGGGVGRCGGGRRRVAVFGGGRLEEVVLRLEQLGRLQLRLLRRLLLRRRRRSRLQQLVDLALAPSLLPQLRVLLHPVLKCVKDHIDKHGDSESGLIQNFVGKAGSLRNFANVRDKLQHQAQTHSGHNHSFGVLRVRSFEAQRTYESERTALGRPERTIVSAAVQQTVPERRDVGFAVGLALRTQKIPDPR